MRDAWLVYVASASLFLLVCGALAAAWTRGRLAVAAGALFLLALVVWFLDFAAISADYRDADEFADCLDACTGVHFGTAVGFLLPPLLLAVSAFAGLIALVERRRARQVR
jgi:hypothetical protein